MYGKMLEKQTEEYQKKLNGHDFSYKAFMALTSRYPKTRNSLFIFEPSFFEPQSNFNRKARETRT